MFEERLTSLREVVQYCNHLGDAELWVRGRMFSGTNRKIAFGAIAAVAAFVVVTVPTERASADVKSACVLEAAQRLPHIPGLKIAGSRVRLAKIPKPKPKGPDLGPFAHIKAPPSTDSDSPDYLVDIDVLAAGQHGTYRFLCGPGVAGSVIVVPCGVCSN